MRYNERKWRVLAVFENPGWLNPPVHVNGRTLNVGLVGNVRPGHVNPPDWRAAAFRDGSRAATHAFKSSHITVFTSEE